MSELKLIINMTPSHSENNYYEKIVHRYPGSCEWSSEKGT